MAYEPYYQHYESKGLAFDRSVLTTYCLSLRTKPFVILSGISGTGKTKIAQFFNVPATAAIPKAAPPAPAAAPPGQWIIMRVTGGVVGDDGRANFRYSDLGALLSASEIAALQPRIAQLAAEGVDDNICDPFDFVIETPDGQTLMAKAYLQRASSPLLRVRFKSKRGEPPYDSTPYFAQHYPVGTVLKLEKIADKRLRIVSVNDVGVVQKAQELEEQESAQVKNTCFMSVRSDWTDPTPLFGYYNLIDQRYYLTPVLTFILTAKEHPELPFFLVLDEMNLARVEHYFSDFLSCLESRFMEGGNLKQEPIHLHSDSGWVNTNNEYFDLIGPSLELPSNLYVTGTVNVDESTYMFSPKVLDRANVIELNDVDLESYGDAAAAQGAASKASFLLKAFPDFTKSSLPQKSDFEALPPDVKGLLTQVHALLAKHNLHFGYRVINEISSYVRNATAFCEPHSKLVDEAVDWQMIQKVLPKLAGPQSKLDLPIRELIGFLREGKKDASAMDMDAIGALNPNATRYPRAVAKLKRMALSLAINGYATFIE